MPDFGSTVKSLLSRGMEAVGNAASSLASSTRFKVDELNLNNKKSEILRGFGIRAYEMWKQGAQFPAELVALLEQVAEADAELERLRAERAAQSDSAGSAEQAPSAPVIEVPEEPEPAAEPQVEAPQVKAPQPAPNPVAIELEEVPEEAPAQDVTLPVIDMPETEEADAPSEAYSSLQEALDRVTAAGKQAGDTVDDIVEKLDNL